MICFDYWIGTILYNKSKSVGLISPRILLICEKVSIIVTLKVSGLNLFRFKVYQKQIFKHDFKL